MVPPPAPDAEPGLRARLEADAPSQSTPDPQVAGEGAPPPAEAPAGVGEPAPGAAQGEDFLRRLRLTCKEIDHRVAGYLNGTCELQSLENGVLVLAFYQLFSLHKEKIEAPAYRRIVEEAASKLTGQAVTLQCTLGGQARPPGPVKSGGHLVQAARQMGARPVIGGKGGPSGAARNEP